MPIKIKLLYLANEKRKTNLIIYLYVINHTVHLRLYVMLIVFFSQLGKYTYNEFACRLILANNSHQE